MGLIILIGGEEIQAWFDKNGMPNKFVIIDDKDISGYFDNHFVLTSMSKGLDETVKQEIIKIFS